ncbi:hypothetical protein BDV27DRAFT_59539 [Aspergillus caelatus]|uniref:Uncharacterized protein n=1 Tax=Aspergillus caelatus TaxID=61420 RepID=A0A5N7ADD7_9EURO|nr:uncharacterized protein BDV27DRAFT_59539 [Aspergillus caelatus]KAE8367881.1 hypothetical protein BDV27DRAFT_59539 [Aspergillus caelatus]
MDPDYSVFPVLNVHNSITSAYVILTSAGVFGRSTVVWVIRPRESFHLCNLVFLLYNLLWSTFSHLYLPVSDQVWKLRVRVLLNHLDACSPYTVL